MIKRISVLAAAALFLVLTTENEIWAQGFGGFHSGGVHVGGAYGRGANVRGVYDRGYGRGVVTGVPAGAIRRGRRYGGYGYGGYGDTFILPPNPGKGPAGIESMGQVNPGGNNLAAADLAKLQQSLKQMSLPSDAGLPAVGSGDESGEK